MGMRHPHNVLQMVGMQRSELNQMHEMFLDFHLLPMRSMCIVSRILPMVRRVLMLRGRDGAQLQDGVPSSCKESQELNKGSLASWVVR